MKKVLIIFSIIGICFYRAFLVDTTYQIEKKTYEASKAEQAAFIQEVAPLAQAEMKNGGIFASITIAQAIIESGWGKGGITSINNYFGVKRGVGSNACSYVGETIQDEGNGAWGGKSECKMASEGVLQFFRVYNSISESVQDHTIKFWCASRYAPLLNATSMEEQLKALASSGYRIGTQIFDEYYYNHLLNIINQYHLTQYDAGISYDGSKPSYANNCKEGTGNTGTPFTGKEEAYIPYTEQYNYLNLDTGYTGDYTKGYIYTKYHEMPFWKNMVADDDEQRVDLVIGNVFRQGEKLYGDGKIHMESLITDGTSQTPPMGGEGAINTNGMPLPEISCYTSPFGYRGNIGVAGASSNHKGIDLPATTGTNIFTIGDGTVTHAGWYGSGGNTVIVDHGNGIRTLYMHMSKILVSKGDVIGGGQTIGLVGSTGASSGPHLHFQYERNGTAIDPQTVFPYLANIGKC